MIIPLGGGGSKVVASIVVTYPAGSTLTCTLGSKVLTAKNTSGKWVFGLPSTGNWVVKAVKGSQSASKTVSITAEGQVETVELAYELVIYDAGSFGKNTNGTTFDAKKSDDNNASSITKNSAYMLWECGANAWCIFYINPKVSCTGYKTLKISLTNASTNIDSDDAGIGKFGLKSNNNTDSSGFVAKTTFNSLSGSRTLSLNVSNVGTTAYYVAMQFGTPSSGGSFSARVTKIWLE